MVTPTHSAAQGQPPPPPPHPPRAYSQLQMLCQFLLAPETASPAGFHFSA